MATYGRGQMLGAGIDPRMFVQDYSGFARAGAIQGQGMAQLGADIGNIGKQFGEFKKQQAEQEKQVKSAELVAKAISDSFPSLAPMAQEAMFILGDKNNPLSDRLAAAQAIETSLKIGSGLLAEQQNAQLASQKMAMQMEEQQRSANEIVAVENIYRGNEEIQMGRTRGGQLVPVGQMVQNALSQDKTLQPLPTSMETEADRQGRAVEINNETDAAPMVLPIGDRTEEQIKDEDAISRSIGEQPTLGVRPRYRELAQQQQGIVMTPEQLQQEIASGRKVNAVPVEGGNYRVTGITAGGAPLVNVNTGQGLQGQREKMIDESLIAVKNDAAAAAGQLGKIEEVSKLLDEGVRTGFAQDVLMKGRRILGQDVSNEEAFKAATGNIAIGFINLTKGAISDREMTYFTEVLAPNIGASVEGNKKIVGFLRGAAEKAAEIDRVISDGMRTGKTPFEIDEQVQKIRNKTTLVDEESELFSPEVQSLIDKHTR